MLSRMASVDSWVCEKGLLDPAMALRITKEVAEALRYLLLEGYIHRDVKPENILLGRDGKAKICDMGFATEIQSIAEGKSDQTQGTVAYMSPEQARGEMDLRGGTDIYALGLSLYFMLSAHDAFRGDSSESILSTRFADGGVSVNFDQMRAPVNVVALVKRMTNPDRQRRFRSYDELFQAMKDLR